jgi:shikimate kinase
MNIALIGARCSGKTSVGRRLADRLWWEFVDTDDLIEQRAGKTIAEITDNGKHWKPFRDLEKQIVAEVAGGDQKVIGCGGGVVLDPDNVEALRAGARVIWLQCEPEVLYARMTADPATASQRPNLTAEGGLAEMRKTVAERAPFYEAAAHVNLDVTHMSIEDIVYHLARLCL